MSQERAGFLQVRAHSVFVEEEVEYHLCDVLDGVKKKLEGFSLSGEQSRIVFWRTPFYESQVCICFSCNDSFCIEIWNQLLM